MKRTRARSQASGLTAAPLRIDGVAVRRVGEELVVYDPDTTCTHVLDPVATAVFGAVDGVRTCGELGLNASLTMGKAVSSDQVDRALVDLSNAGLVRLRVRAQPPYSSFRRGLLWASAAPFTLRTPATTGFGRSREPRPHA